MGGTAHGFGPNHRSFFEPGWSGVLAAYARAAFEIGGDGAEGRYPLRALHDVAAMRELRSAPSGRAVQASLAYPS